MNGSVLVIGGGIACIQTSLDLTELVFKVHLIEREPSIGSRMAQFDKLFPTKLFLYFLSKNVRED